MTDDTNKKDRRDRDRIAVDEPYEVEYFQQRHKHLTHEEAIAIIKDTRGNREKADAAAERLKGQ